MTLVARYVGWLERRARAVFAVSALLVAASVGLIAFRLPLRSDLSDLLPADTPSVRAARAIEARLRAKDTLLMLVVAPDAAERVAAASEAIAGARAIGPDLVERIEADDAEARAFLRERRHLYVPLADLVAARDALARRIQDAKARANPLLVRLDDETEAADPSLDELRRRQRDADARLSRSAFVSADGRTQVVIVRTSFRATDVERDVRLQQALDEVAARVRARHPSVEVGFTGGVTAAVAEHRALARGMLWSSLISGALVVLVLLLHLRGLRLLTLLMANIVAATVVSFGAAALTVGHLNAATAFLGAILAGNGINYGILLAARYLEERPAAAHAREALAAAIAGTLRPTLVASLGAAVAYGALAVTHFRGFADFAAIGGLGMLVCWIASFTLLPAMMLRFASAPGARLSPLFGELALRVFGFRRPAVVCALALVASVGAGLVCWRYAAGDPFEHDMAQLRSRAPDAVRSRRWMRVSDEAFGRGLAGVAGRTFIAVDRPEELPALVDALRALQQREPIVGPVQSILDAVPPDQERKLAVLAELRAQIDEASRTRDPALRAELASLRPPDALRPIAASDLPAELAARFTELDGRVGCMVAVRPGPAFDEWDGRDLIRFARALREVRLASGEVVSAAGPSVLFADVLNAIRRDGVAATAAAALGLLLLVLIAAGSLRRGLAVLASTAAGSLFMIAACALAGLKINFLDFVALPVTLGLGVDYAINVAHRASREDPRTALRSTGGTVLVCSLTTVIGYASLLVSDNLAIRGYGLASLIGEITCVTAALVLVPALLALRPGLYHQNTVAKPTTRLS
jgi:predicted RND superfamily exporter protein